MALRFLSLPLLLLGLLCAGAANAAPIDRIALADLGTIAATRVAEDGTVALEDGRSLRLAGVDLPRGASAHDAVLALTGFVGRGPLALKGDGPAEDRYGRVVAQAFAADGTWIEGELLRQGLARVATTVDHRAAAAALYAAERGARGRRVGLWSDPATALRRPEQAAHMIDSWQVVAGTVAAAVPRHSGFDLRFGDDPARDLAVRVPGEVARGLDDDATDLVGRRIIVRGWIGKGAGPLIILSHAEQIELVARSRSRESEEP